MKVHFVDSTNTVLKAVTSILKELDIDSSVSGSIDDAFDIVQKENPSIVFINWTLPNKDIEALIKKIRSIKSGNYIYSILMVGKEKEKNVSSLLKAGADDFILKPLSVKELQLRMQIAQKVIKSQESAGRIKKKLLKYAKEDPHTGLLNRRALLDEALKEMGRASRDGKNFSAIMVSATNLKRIISSYGAEMGDDILMEFSRRLKVKCRPYDIAGRYGIADFLVFLPDTGVHNAEKVAQRILTSLTEKPFTYKGRQASVSVSIGLSEMNSQDVVDNNNVDAHLLNDLLLDALVKRSETALNKASTSGRNSIVVQGMS